MLRLGVFALVRAKEKHASNTAEKCRRIYYSVYIYGTEQLRYIAQHLSFVGEKQNALQALRELPQASNPNLDLVPAVTPLVKEAARLAGVSVKRHRVGRSKLAAYVEQRCEASRGGLLEVIGQIEQLSATPEHARDHLDRLTTLATSDVYWDEIVGIEQVEPPDPWVYDLSIAETHNFVANNIIVHNSNIADAVRWVLGEQSYAALRSKRTEDLIFGGGGRRAPSGLAEVSLTIDNSDRLLSLPYGEVTISRRATRAGDNEYFINRSRVRLRDLHEAVGPLGGSYTIINQGLVDAALTLRPDERRRLFEDAAEISVYEARKTDAERRLRETEANLERCADVLVELEPRLRSLKRQAGLARSHRELTAELHELLVRHYAATWRAAQRTLAEAEAAERQLEADLRSRRAAQAAATAELRDVRQELRALRERLGALHAESSALHTRAEAAQRDLAVGNERQAALKRRGEEIERGQHEFELRGEEIERERAAISGRLEAAEGRLAEQRVAAGALEREFAAREDERRAARRTLDAAQRAELEATAALAERRRRVEQLTAQRERAAREQAGHAEALAGAEAALAAQHETLAAAHARVSAAEQALTAATTAAEQARAELEAARAERSRSDETIAVARRSLADVEARLETLSRLQRSFAGVKAAMQWAESHGRASFALVSSLIRTPAHLETAVEVALGSRLQNIVVERWNDAEEAIAALKRGGQGRATFLPLDTLRPPTAARQPPVKQDGVLGVAADLVDYDQPYRSVVQYLLGRVLIVRELSTARSELNQLSGGWTIVTLAGEQVSSGGAVTGGAQTRESGALRRERELRELPEQLAAQRHVLAEAQLAREALDTRAAAAERALREVETGRRRASQEHEALREARDRARRAAEQAEADLAWQRRRHVQTETALKDLDDQQATLRDEQAALEAREGAARAQLAGLRAEEQAQGTADQELQQRLAGLRAAVAAAEGEARTERVLLQSQRHNLARLEEQRTAGARRLEELAGEREALAAHNRALATSHAELLNQIDELRRRIGPAEIELEALESSQATLEHREAELTAALLDGEAAHGRASVDVQRARDRLDALWERAAADDIDIETVTQETTERKGVLHTPPEELVGPSLRGGPHETQEPQEPVDATSDTPTLAEQNRAHA